MRPARRFIDTRSATNVIEARKHADEIGRPFNRFYTVNTHHTTFEGDGVSAAWQAFLQNRYVRTLRSYGEKVANIGPPTYIWVIENKRGRLHIHWLVHMDSEFEAIFKQRITRWITKEFGQILDRSAAFHETAAWNPAGATDYMLKGMKNGPAKVYRIKTEDAGDVRGKRAGHSRNLGPEAIKRYWKKREQPQPHGRKENAA